MKIWGAWGTLKFFFDWKDVEFSIWIQPIPKLNVWHRKFQKRTNYYLEKFPFLSSSGSVFSLFEDTHFSQKPNLFKSNCGLAVNFEPKKINKNQNENQN